MLKNWSKIVLVSMLVLATAVPVFATTARIRSLANTGDYMSDDANVYRWLSTLPSYANQVNAAVGTWNRSTAFNTLSDTRGLAWIFGTEKYGTYRITLDENAVGNPGFWMINPFYSDMLPGSAGNLFGTGNGGNTPVNTFDLGGGWEIGDNMAIGVNYTHSRYSYEATDPTTDANNVTAKNSLNTIGAGFSWTDNEKLVLDILFNLGMASGEWQSGTNGTKYEYDGSSGFDLGARLFWDWKDNITVPVVFEWASSDYSAKPNTQLSSAVSGDKMNGFKLGAAVNMDVNQDHMLIFAVEMASYKWEYSNGPSVTNAADTLSETSWFVLPTFRLALESSITSWLTTRIGAARHVTKVTAKDQNGDEVKWTGGSLGNNEGPINVTPPGWADYSSVETFQWFLGAGFNVAEWTIDMELAQETPFSIGYWLTGYSAFGETQGSYGPVGRISAVYNY